MDRLLIIGYVWPEPNSSAAGTRMLQLIEFFLSEKYAVTFATTASETVHISNLEEIGVQTESIQLNNSSFDEFIKSLNPTIVLFDRFMMEEQFGWRVSKICPNALKILDTEDLHFLRKLREEAVKNKIPEENPFFESDLVKREIASIYRCDVSLIISEMELELLKSKYKVPESPLLYLPFMLKSISEKKIEKLPPFEERNHFISIGNFRHEPNWDAVLNLKENIWAKINKNLPRAELHIYGAYPPEKAFRLNDPKTGFLIKGRANSAEKTIKNARVLLAPLRFGAGLKGKLINAMQFGTPSVTSKIGAEGISGDLPWNGLIEDNPDRFIEFAISLYTNKTNWKKAQQNGFKIIEERFSEITHRQSIKNRISALLNDLKSHRKQNFTGAILTHHSLQSTKYLSKYIEAKNELEQFQNKEKTGKIT